MTLLFPATNPGKSINFHNSFISSSAWLLLILIAPSFLLGFQNQIHYKKTPKGTSDIQLNHAYIQSGDTLAFVVKQIRKMVSGRHSEISLYSEISGLEEKIPK